MLKKFLIGNVELLVKPGITGWAQIRFKYAADIGSSAEKLGFDLFYLKNTSLLLDLEIMLATSFFNQRKSMSKVLVTGGAGYIGSHTTLQLLEAGYEVVVLDNYSNSSPKSLERVSRLTAKTPIIEEGDITDQSFLSSVFKKYPDICSVIHFAALKAVGESTEIPLAYYNNNVTGSIFLLDEMRNAGVHKLVFSSSCTVYGEPSRVPISEDFPVGSVSSPYGRTKYMMEGIIEDFASSMPDFNCGVLRYFNPVGAHPSGEIGEDLNGIPNNLVPFVCQVASGKLEKLKIFVTIIQLGMVPLFVTIFM